MAYGIPSKDELEVRVIARDDHNNEAPLAVIEFDRHVDFTRNKIMIRVVVQASKATP